MTATPATARALIRQAAGQHTLYLVRRPTTRAPELTIDVPCGQTRAVTLGRWPLDAMPTDDELAEDIEAALIRLCGAKRRTAAASKPRHSARSTQDFGRTTRCDYVVGRGAQPVPLGLNDS